jgi:anti-sigma B factor antagonist
LSLIPDAALPHSPKFGVDELWHGQVAVIAVSGTIDLLTVPRLSRTVQSVLSKRPVAVIIDLMDVEFLASAGMAALVEAHNQAVPDVGFAVVADGPSTSRPMKIIGLTDLIDVYPSLAQALDRFTS